MNRLTKEIVKWKKEIKKRNTHQQRICSDCLAWLTVQAEVRILTRVERILQDLIKERQKEIGVQLEDKWYQRAKNSWVKKGDRNTAYFHQLATVRKRKNWIDQIQEGDITVTDHKQKSRAFFNHFVQLIGTPHNSTLNFEFGALYTPQVERMQQLTQASQQPFP